MIFKCRSSGVYIPFWFLTKKDCLWYQAPRNYVFLLQRLSKMPKKVQEIVRETVQRGAWSCHEETGKAKVFFFSILMIYDNSSPVHALQ